jgi:hypothetical protein
MSQVVDKNSSLEFSKRLKVILCKKNKSLSPTALARDFNLRWRGVPVTVNATRKWLMGEAIPTFDKLVVLANLIDVSEDWLRWGDLHSQENLVQCGSQKNLTHDLPGPDAERALLQDYRLLSPLHKKIVRDILVVLLKNNVNN